jgi:hypothetical protein
MTSKDNDASFVKSFNYSAQEIMETLLSVDVTRPLVRGDIVTDINGYEYIVMGVPLPVELTSPPIESSDPVVIMGGWSPGPATWDLLRAQKSFYIQPGLEVPAPTHQHIPVEKRLTVLSVKLARGQDGTYGIISVGHMQLFADIERVKLAIYI